MGYASFKVLSHHSILMYIGPLNAIYVIIGGKIKILKQELGITSKTHETRWDH